MLLADKLGIELVELTAHPARRSVLNDTNRDVARVLNGAPTHRPRRSVSTT